MSTTRFYKINKGTATFEAVDAMIKRIREAQSAADELSKELGCEKNQVLTYSHYVAGGIVGFKLEQQPDGWKKVHSKSHYGFYFPKASVKANKQLLKRIDELPSIQRRDLSDLVGYKSIMGAPGIKQTEDSILVEMTSGGWGDKAEPTADMIEILGSEYDELCKLETVES